MNKSGKANSSKKVFAAMLSAVVAVSSMVTAQAAENTPADMSAFSAWKTSAWDSAAQYDSGKIAVTPGKTISEMNFAWYSKAKGTPRVKISSKSDMTGNPQVFTGTAGDIIRSNGVNSYAAGNRVTVTGLTEKSVYYYSYTTNDADWSQPEILKTQSSSSLELICVGDPQIGASSGSNNIVYDTYQWNKTVQSAVASHPDTNFILSVGDQINQASDGKDNGQRREQEYAGFLYPQALRNYPLATAIGNHESMSADYSMHYNNPNAQKDLGNTASGGDYYFNYGKVLFIVLNSNNRNAAEHDTLMQKALADPSSKDAQWKIAVMHHDIYGSGEPHSDVDGANLRALFAPLMDKYNMDVCLTGHDHSYARTYQIMDGKAIDYTSDQVTDPQGTLYIAMNSASGSKFYELNAEKQYFINKRDQQSHPNYSVVDISSGRFSIKTVDAVTNSAIDEYSIAKTSAKQSLYNTISAANKIVNDSAFAATYTESSRNDLLKALQDANALLATKNDAVPQGMFGNYDKTVQGNNTNDKLNYYAYDSKTDMRVETGYSAFIDKTMDNRQVPLAGVSIDQANEKLAASMDKLVKLSDAQSSGGSSADEPSSAVSAISTPKTGDNTETALAVLSCLLLAGMIAAVTVRVKKREM